MVYPSGALVVTAPIPTLPPAPGRFSTTKDWPNMSFRRSARMRVSTSVEPPAGYGTTMRTGRSGQRPSSARAAVATIVPAAAIDVMKVRRVCMDDHLPTAMSFFPPILAVRHMAAITIAHPVLRSQQSFFGTYLTRTAILPVAVLFVLLSSVAAQETCKGVAMGAGIVGAIR